jgi:DNA-binding MarR family transcriptional regulator
MRWVYGEVYVVDTLKLENQLCFPLYAAARKVMNLYLPLLKPLDLTYTQYITMMVLWEEQQISVKRLGEKLRLDSGTLTPLLKRLEKQGRVSRVRDPKDERSLLVSVTTKGMALKDAAAGIPEAIGRCVNLDAEDAAALYTLLYKIIQQ